MQEKVISLEDKLDATEAYERRDTIILSGAVPAVSPNENISRVTVDLIRSKYRNVEINPEDISICHRLQDKAPTTSGSQRAPNIYVKFVRRDKKRELIQASKGQAREAQHKLFANESLTPQRTAIRQTLLKLKRSVNIVKGVTSNEGQVIVFTAPQGENGPQGANRRRDQRHVINSKRDLQTFCDTFLRRPLEDFVDTWPPTRQQ